LKKGFVGYRRTASFSSPSLRDVVFLYSGCVKTAKTVIDVVVPFVRQSMKETLLVFFAYVVVAFSDQILKCVTLDSSTKVALRISDQIL